MIVRVRWDLEPVLQGLLRHNDVIDLVGIGENDPKPAEIFLR